MAKRNNIFFFVVIVFLCWACGQETIKQDKNTQNEKKLNYAKCFKIYDFENYQLIKILNQKQIIGQYVLYKKDKPELNINNAVFIKIPITKIAALSSIYIGFLNQLNELKNINAIDNSNYIFNQYILEKVKQNNIKEIAINGQINDELTIHLRPDVVFTYFDQAKGNSKNQKLTKAEIPVVSLIDHLEDHPLGRAEWIKFFACFFIQEKLADSLFSATEKKYNALKQLAATSKIKPKVLTEHKLNDAWYVPGGKSYMAALLQDANTNYIWRNDEHTGSLPLSFEEVYTKAINADYWLNVLFCNSKADLIKLDNRYKNFYAFEKNQIFNNNLLVSDIGANDYWETGLTQPDLILNDIISIVHPELKSTKQLRFYQQLK